MNNCNFIGRLTRDPEVRYTQSGKAITEFDIAVDMGKDGQGNKQTEFVPIQTWGKQAENCGNYLGKGRLVGISNASFKVSRWKDEQGNKHSRAYFVAHEVKFLDYDKASGSSISGDVFPDEDIPF